MIRLHVMDVPSSGAFYMNRSPYLTIGYLLRDNWSLNSMIRWLR